jgi:carbon storage regulator CsrA
MLVLTRRVGQEMLIGGHIRITVAQLQGGKVRLGIEAPAQVPVDRQEVHQRRQEFAPIRAVTGEDEGLPGEGKGPGNRLRSCRR